MSEETNEVEAPVEASPETPQATPAVNLDQTLKVGGEEYTAQELSETLSNFETLREYAQGLEQFQSATMRLMDPNTSTDVKKKDARDILLASNYSPEQVDEWVKIYDENPQMNEGQPQQPQSDPLAQQAMQNSQAVNDEVLKLRGQMLQQNMENAVSSAFDGNENGKVLMDWLGANREGDDLNTVKDNLSERVRAQALENLRQRRNQAGTFEDSWLGEEVTKAADKVAKDMLTVIGDTSKIGRVSETEGQTENLYRKDPVKLPDTKGKSFGDVEGQLRNWTSDQLLRSLSDPGGDTKA